MNNETYVDAAPTPTTADQFMQTLRKTLEHLHDPEWLAKESPLASVFFYGANRVSARQKQVTLTGRTEIDTRLRSIWHSWEERTKTPLQALLWEAVCRLPVDLDNHPQATLLLTYYDDEQPKQREVIKRLAIGRSTYYRHLERAVALLDEVLMKLLRPALRLEQPVARPLVGRHAAFAQAQQVLAQNGTVHLVGGSGLGKSALGAQLAAHWPHGLFWYTFRPGLTDYLEQVLFAMAYFLHDQGSSGLWRYLTTLNEPMQPARAIMALHSALGELADKPPLFCFDEVDLLLGDDLHDSADHQQLRQLLEAWSKSAVASSPLLLMGQKLLLEPDPDGLITLTPFTTAEVNAFTNQAAVVLSAEQRDHLLTITRGNPLLLRLALALYQQSATLGTTMEQLTTPVTLDWFITRLTHHLTPAEQLVLQELAVFAGGAPQDSWRRHQKQLESLVQLGIIERSAQTVSLHPALRRLLYDRLPSTQRSELHLAAAQLLAERARFTDAAWHYIKAGRPDVAIWSWYTHQQEEIEQGQASAALDMFLPLTQEPLPRLDDQRALALLLAPLLKRVGRAQEGLALLDASPWPSAAVSTVLAQELRGDLLAEVGAIDRGLREMRRGLELFQRLRVTHEAELHLQVGRRAFARLGDLPQTEQQIAEAQLSIAVLQGRMAEATGDYAAARTYLQQALKLAANSTDWQRLAKIHEGLGMVEARYANLTTATEHFIQARDLYQHIGNEVAAVGIYHAGLAMAHLIAHRYEAAIAPAEWALAFFEKQQHAYWIALNQTYLAEAWLYCNELEKAERYAQAALTHEEVVVRPYCLFLLGHVRRRQGEHQAAIQLCRSAIDEGEALQDRGAIAPAWLALAEAQRDAGCAAEAAASFQQAISHYEQLGLPHELAHVKMIMKVNYSKL